MFGRQSWLVHRYFGRAFSGNDFGPTKFGQKWPGPAPAEKDRQTHAGKGQQEAAESSKIFSFSSFMS
jgi:hypothetical protein